MINTVYLNMLFLFEKKIFNTCILYNINYFSPETDSGSESLKLSCQTSSQASTTTTTGMPEAAAFNSAETLASLTSSFKVRLEKNRFPPVI